MVMSKMFLIREDTLIYYKLCTVIMIHHMRRARKEFITKATDEFSEAKHTFEQCSMRQQTIETDIFDCG